MKTLLILSAVMVAACAVPEGYYKQEYQFKKSSATYRDNQLETKNDDEGFYGKQGDLSGQTAPKVAQHNQHSEFISPAVDNMGHSLTTYNDRDLTDEAESAFRNHNIQPGTNRQYSHTSNQFHGQRGSSSSSSNTPTYSSHSNLGQVTQNLQYDMEKQVREALRSMHGQSQYGSQMRNEDMQYLENQLRSNITRQLQQSLQSQYGAQTTRGHSSYSTTSSGGYNPTANYDTTELNNLRQQMETALLKQLRDGARSTHSQTASSSSWNSYGSSNRGETDDLTQHGHRVIPTSSTNYRSVPYGTSNDDLQRPERLSYGQQPSSGSQTSYGSSHGQTGSRQYVTTYDRDFPTLAQSQITVNPTKRITDVMQTVQNDVTEQVRQALNTYQAKYSNPTYTLTNSRPLYQSGLDDLKRQLRYNITRHVEDELIHNYGHQDVRGEYSFSRNQRTNANYKTADLDDLKEQIENNLVNYLETSFRSYEKHNQQSRTQYTNSQRDFTQQGPQYTQSLTSDIAQNPNHVQYEPNRSWSSSSSWSSAASYGSGSGTGSTQQPLNSQLEQIRSQLQQDLNRQLHAAVYDQKSQSSHSTQSSSQVEHLLSNELKSNLTRRLQESLNEHYGNQGIRGGQSYTISTSGAYSPQANYRTEDLNQLRQQLQDSLVRNLQEQLRTSQYSTSSGDYSSGHRSQGPTRPIVVSWGQRTIDDPLEEEDDFIQKSIEDNDAEMLHADSQSKPIRGDIGQTPIPDKKVNKTQQVGQQRDNHGQQTEDDDFESFVFGSSQKPVKDDDYTNFQLGSNRRPSQASSQNKPHLVGQQTEDIDTIRDDDFQKPVEDDYFQLGSNIKPSQLQTGSQRKPNLVGQQTEDMGQHTEDLDSIHMGQQSEDIDTIPDDVQKPVEDDYAYLLLGSNRKPSQLQTGSQRKPNLVGQQTEYMGQQTEDLNTSHMGQQSEDFGKIPDDDVQKPIQDDYAPFQLGINRKPSKMQTGSQHKPSLVGQETEDFDNVQSPVGDQYDHFQLGSNRNPSQLQSGNQRKPIELGRNKNNGNLETYNQHSVNKLIDENIEDIGQQTEDLGQKIEDLGQQTMDVHYGATNPHNTYGQQTVEDYDDILLGVKPLEKTTTTTSKPWTTTYGPYVLRYRPYTTPSGIYRPTHTTTTESFIQRQQQHFDRLAQHLSEMQGTQDGFNNDFINHGDYLQHKPQPHENDFQHPDDMDFTQQQQEGDFLKNLENVNPASTGRSLHDVQQAYIAQNQNANTPQFNPNVPSRIPLSSSTMDTNQKPMTDQDDMQQRVEPETFHVPMYQQRGRSYNSYASQGHISQVHGQEIEEPEMIPEKTHKTSQDEKDTSSAGIEEEEAVTEVVQPLGFWQKVGGKISSGYNSVKKKAKDLVGAS